MKIFLLLAFWFAACIPVGSKAAPLIQPNDRLAICGDEMTSSLGYSIYIEDYLLMCQPIAGINISQFGWSAGTAQVFCSRLDTDVLPFKPTVVMTCFGMNDGGFKPLNDETANTYRKAQTDMVQTFKKAGVRTIILGSPRCVNPLTYRGGPDEAIVYNKTLSTLAEIDKEIAAKEGVVYADVFGATTKAMEAAKAQYGKTDVLGTDPEDRWSHLAVASAFLKALGCDGNIGNITVDYKASTATCDPAQKIASFVGKTMKVESTRYPFCFSDSPATSDTVLQCIPFNADLNRYRLVMKNLPSQRVRVAWNLDIWCDYRAHESRNFTADEMGKGVNLAAAFAHIPGGQIPFRSFGEVNGAVSNQQQQERTSGATFVTSKEKDVAGEALRNEHFKTALNKFVPAAHTFKFQALSPEEIRYSGPINVIVDTDMSSDCDDAGAMALIGSFVNQGEAKLIACVVNGRDEDLCSGATVQAINAYYGLPSVPIGANHGQAWIGSTKSHYTLKIHQRFNPDFPTDDKLPAGTKVYRKALASAADGTVVIASIGLMENLQDLVNSKPDAISNLSGLDLVRKKVRKLVIMSNTCKYDNTVLGIWPTKILYTFGVGSYISTGKSLAKTPENNPVRAIYQLFGKDEQENALVNGRQSWDLTAAWLAVRGVGDLWDESWGGHFSVDPETGKGDWVDGPHMAQSYILEKMEVPEVIKLIETELARLPNPR